MNNNQIADLFLEQHILQPAQIEDVLQEASLSGKSLARTMIDSGFVRIANSRVS